MCRHYPDTAPRRTAKTSQHSPEWAAHPGPAGCRWPDRPQQPPKGKSVSLERPCSPKADVIAYLVAIGPWLLADEPIPCEKHRLRNTACTGILRRATVKIGFTRRGSIMGLRTFRKTTMRLTPCLLAS